MPKAIDIQELLAQIKQLGKHEQMTLLNKLILIVRRSNDTQTPLSAISGIGADIWKDIDIDKYVESEREW